MDPCAIVFGELMEGQPIRNVPRENIPSTVDAKETANRITAELARESRQLKRSGRNV